MEYKAGDDWRTLTKMLRGWEPMWARLAKTAFADFPVISGESSCGPSGIRWHAWRCIHEAEKSSKDGWRPRLITLLATSPANPRATVGLRPTVRCEITTPGVRVSGLAKNKPTEHCLARPTRKMGAGRFRFSQRPAARCPAQYAGACPLVSRTVKQCKSCGRPRKSKLRERGPSQARKNNAIGEVLGKLFKAGGNYDREYLARPRVP